MRSNNKPTLLMSSEKQRSTLRTRVIILGGMVAAQFASAPADEPAQRGEIAKAAAIAKLEADIERATQQKAEAVKGQNRDRVKRFAQELRSLHLHLNKAKAKSPEQYAEDMDATEDHRQAQAAKRKQAEEADAMKAKPEVVAARRKNADAMMAFWADPQGKATVAAARLYRDLQTFRRKPDFIEFGFGKGGPYHLWLTAAETVAARDGKAGALKLMENYDCSLAELPALGRAYMWSRGQDTPYSMDVERRLAPAMEAAEKEAEFKAGASSGKEPGP